MKSKLRLIGLFLVSMSLRAGALQQISASLRAEATSIVADVAVLVLTGLGLWGAGTGRYAVLIGATAGIIVAVKADTIVPWLQSL